MNGIMSTPPSNRIWYKSIDGKPIDLISHRGFNLISKLYYILFFALFALVACDGPRGGHSVSTHFASNPLEGIVCADNQILYITLDGKPVEVHPRTDFAKMVKLHNYGEYGVIELLSPLTEIGSVPFGGNRLLAAVTLPESVVKIDRYAFSGCQALQYINIPDGVTEIGIRAFGDCHSLKSAVVPDSVTLIRDYAFAGCWSMEKMVVGRSVSRIGERAFSGCAGQLTVNCNIPAGNFVTDYVADYNSVSEYIGIFQYSEFTEVIVGEGVTIIGSKAFSSNHSLERVVLPTSLREISRFAFDGCTKLNTIVCNAPLPPKLKMCAIPKNEPLVKTYVPTGSVARYRDVRRWGRRSEIVAQ